MHLLHIIPFFATAAPPVSAVAPQISQIIGITHIYGTLMLSHTGTCSSSPPAHPHTFHSPAQTLIRPHQKRKGYIHSRDGEAALPLKWYNLVQHVSTCFIFIDFW